MSNNDQKWLQEKYPGLTIARENGIQIVSGDFKFDAIFDDKRITDTYEVRIELQGNQFSDLPKVIETGSRIRKISAEREIPLSDLHSYEDGSACLCVKLVESGYFLEGFSFPIFIKELIIPFFYAQSFFEDFNDWPWETYSHGKLGWIEWYLDQKYVSPEITDNFLKKLKSTQDWQHIQNELGKKGGVKGHHQCICGSSLRYRNCHKKVFRGFWKLQQDAKEFSILI
ncbi:hypothetical protein ACFLUA_03415 [Chloroflexota bacterium]